MNYNFILHNNVVYKKLKMIMRDCYNMHVKQTVCRSKVSLGTLYILLYFGFL